MTRFLLVCLGGAIGTGARYAVAIWARQALGDSFPYGTLAVNVVGSFLLAVIMVAGAHAEVLSPTTRLVLSAGVMGGFTTYSSFNWETLMLFEERSFRLGFVYVAATLAGCLIAGLGGLAVARRLFDS